MGFKLHKLAKNKTGSSSINIKKAPIHNIINKETGEKINSLTFKNLYNFVWCPEIQKRLHKDICKKMQINEECMPCAVGMGFFDNVKDIEKE